MSRPAPNPYPPSPIPLYDGSQNCGSDDGHLAYLFFAGNTATARIAKAKLICAGCRYHKPCGDFALGDENASGVWGGMSEQDRAKRRRKRRDEQKAGL